MRHASLCAALVFVLASIAGSASANLAKLDPRARIALAELRANADLGLLRARRVAVNASGDLDAFIRGPVTRAELEALGVQVRTTVPGLCTAFIPADAVERVAALEGVRSIRGAAPVELELNLSVPLIGAGALRGVGPAFTGVNGAGVLIGDVDSGVDYQHGDFEDAAGNTRLVNIWDQTVQGLPHPPGYTYGTLWTPAQIDNQTCPTTDTDGHGTHVLGIAGGDGSQTGNGVAAYTYAGVAPRSDLLMVKSDFNDTHVVDGVQYCFQTATTRGQNAVVNLSLGSQFGPHDGTDDFEAGLDALTGPGRIIVKSAGNDRGTGRHAEASTLGGNATITLSVNGSTSGAQVAIDGYYEASDNIRVQVTTPNNTILGPFTRGTSTTFPGTDTPNGLVYVENGIFVTPTGDFEIYLQIDVSNADNANGTWTITLLPQGTPANGEVDLWRFYSAGLNAFFLTGVSDDELVSEPGNAEQLITVAAFTTRRTWLNCSNPPQSIGYQSPVPTIGEVSWFSSAGPTRDGRQKPDLAAPGAGIASVNSFDAFPTCPSFSNFLLNDGINHRIDQGTSMAAPHVTGAVALLLQSFGALTPAQVKTYLFTHAIVDNNTGAVWNKDYGRGKLFLDQSVDALLSLFYAELGPRGVTLRWQFGDPSRFASVTIERAEHNGGPWSEVNAELDREDGTTIALDRSASPEVLYFYRLIAVTTDGERMVFGPLEVGGRARSTRFELAGVWPNPSRGVARIDFVVPRESQVRLRLMDLQGREIAVLAQGVHRAGRYQAVWNGTDGLTPAPAGIYFVRLETPDGSLTRRVAITR